MASLQRFVPIPAATDTDTDTEDGGNFQPHHLHLLLVPSTYEPEVSIKAFIEISSTTCISGCQRPGPDGHEGCTCTSDWSSFAIWMVLLNVETVSQGTKIKMSRPPMFSRLVA